MGDFIAVLELVTKIRKRFVGAPSQFNDISAELRNLCNIIHDVDVMLSACESDARQKANLQEIAGSCHKVLVDLEQRLDKCSVLQSRGDSSGRILKRFWERLKWDPEDIREVRDRIMSNVTLLNAIIGQISSQATLATKKGIDRLNEREDDRERLIVLDWLTPIDFAIKQSEITSERQSGTGQWLLDSSEYKSWVENENQTLFCPGMPGAGKTTLTSIVIEHLTTLFQRDRNIGIAYLYIEYRRQAEQKACDLLASVLKQLAQSLSPLPECLTSLCSVHKARQTRPSFEEILKTLRSLAGFHSRVFILVDALDESRADGAREKLLTELFNLQDACGANLFATSRSIPEISEVFVKSRTLEIRANDADVRKFIDSRILNFKAFVRQSPEIQEQIRTKIVRSTQGMFLLACFHLDALQYKTSVKKLQIALTKIPIGRDGYDSAYDDTMKRIEGQPSDHVELAKQILSWLTCAKRPLKTSELQEALAVELGELELDENNRPDVEDMISVCAGLVTVDEGGDTIRLIHYTTQEYLERTQSTWFPDAETEITSCCITYLSFSTFENGLRRSNRQLLLSDYATRYWTHHARLCSPDPSLISSFLSSPSKMPGVCLLVAAQNGEEASLSWLLDRGVDANVCDETWKTPLHHAVLNSWTRCVELLLARGAKITTDVHNMTPFHYTVSKASEEIAKCFVDAEIPIDVKLERKTWQPVYQEGEMRYIAENETQVSGEEEAGGRKGLTALHYAAVTGSRRMTKFLLDHGADPNAVSGYGETPLHLALKRDLHGAKWPGAVDCWNDPVWRIEVGFEVVELASDSEDEHAWTGAYVEEHRFAVLNLLLDHASTDVNAQDDSGASPLHEVMNRNRASSTIINKLIERKANVSARNQRGQTPLHLACWTGNVGTVVTMLENGADIADGDLEGLNAVHYAARNSSMEVLLHLLANVCPVALARRRDNRGRNALHHLLSGKKQVDPAVVQHLIDNGVDANDLDDMGMSPLANYLSRFPPGHEHAQEVVRLLFQGGADASFRTRSGGLGLVHLYARSRRPTVELLTILESSGVNLQMEDDENRTVLHHCAISGTLTQEVLCFLCNQVGLSARSRDVHGRTPRQYAAEAAKMERHPHVFDPNRWSRTEKILDSLV
ncbi:hypothetical protein CDD83_7484 [Cordyceps sp. RAO-2017]|nr:hypothetical protein CDD83_7484 [Cordyceps sp. RAO-2017]